MSLQNNSNGDDNRNIKLNGIFLNTSQRQQQHSTERERERGSTEGISKSSITVLNKAFVSNITLATTLASYDNKDKNGNKYDGH